jgi:hypothetical protein
LGASSFIDPSISATILIVVSIDYAKSTTVQIFCFTVEFVIVDEAHGAASHREKLV